MFDSMYAQRSLKDELDEYFVGTPCTSLSSEYDVFEPYDCVGFNPPAFSPAPGSIVSHLNQKRKTSKKRPSHKLNPTTKKPRCIERVCADGIEYSLEEEVPNGYVIVLMFAGEHSFQIFSVPISDEYLQDESVRRTLEEGLICRKDIDPWWDSESDAERRVAREKLINMMGVCLCVDSCFQKNIHGAWAKYLIDTGNNQAWSSTFLTEGYKIQVMMTDMRKSLPFVGEECIVSRTRFHECFYWHGK
jgi:hypothetical protein